MSPDTTHTHRRHTICRTVHALARGGSGCIPDVTKDSLTSPSSDAALSVAAQRINNPRAGSGEQGEAEEDEDSDDMVIMADGSSVSLYEHVERVRR